MQHVYIYFQFFGYIASGLSLGAGFDIENQDPSSSSVIILINQLGHWLRCEGNIQWDHH